VGRRLLLGQPGLLPGHADRSLLFLGAGPDRAEHDGSGEALKAKHTATKVDLSKNKIGDAGASALANALLSNDSVNDLDLSNNRIGNAGALAIRDALKNGKSIHQVNLSGNKVQGGSDLASLTGENFAFPSLTISRREENK